MKTEILYQGSMPMLQVYLEQGETLRAEAGAMVYMDPTIDVTGKAQGGFMKGMGRMFTGESFFLQNLIATRGPGKVAVAPVTIGNITEIDMVGRTWYLQKGAFLCSETSVNTSVKTQSFAKGLFSKEGFFIIRSEGYGKLIVSSFGSIHKLVLNNEEIVIDNGHMVAWEESLQYKLEKASKGILSSITSGEGLVARFQGTGTVYIQTRNFDSFLGRLGSINGGNKGIIGRLF